MMGRETTAQGPADASTPLTPNAINRSNRRTPSIPGNPKNGHAYSPQNSPMQQTRNSGASGSPMGNLNTYLGLI
jgi:hypothetical protein